ncbi:MAG: hypothetical protein IKB51_07445 [Clostridia bacterium]|nr:hypothetical protein [Clostridia bacterium]
MSDEKEKEGYISQYQPRMDEILKTIQESKFDYDVTGDALYHQYKDAAMRNGQRAMQDTIGKASALTGGYGNSYAVTAGQQAYNSYMQGLNDVIPELHQLALNKYNQDRSNLMNEYSLLADMDEKAFNSYYAGINAENEAIANYNSTMAGARAHLGTLDGDYNAINAYLGKLVAEGKIGTDDTGVLLGEFADIPLNHLTGWSIATDKNGNKKDGGKNGGGSGTINRNAKVKIGNETYSLSKLYSILTDEDEMGADYVMTKEEAKAWILDLQKKLGIK